MAVGEQAASGGFPVQLKCKHAHVELVLLLFTGKLADEDVVFVDQVDAEPPEVAEPLPAVDGDAAGAGPALTDLDEFELQPARTVATATAPNAKFRTN